MARISDRLRKSDRVGAESLGMRAGRMNSSSHSARMFFNVVEFMERDYKI